ncbi:MAG: hypothetical protein ACMG55_06710 [Microcoleus sp.]
MTSWTRRVPMRAGEFVANIAARCPIEKILNQKFCILPNAFRS